MGAMFFLVVEHYILFVLFLLLAIFFLKMLSFSMLLLLGIVWCLMYPSCLFLPYKQNTMALYSMLVSVLCFFLTKTWVWLFILFEISMFPILFMIISWGYQTERFQAANYFLVYAFVCSLPFFVLLQKMVMLMSISSVFCFYLFGVISCIFLFLPFLVKLPFFFFHLWLPKAHVEAPTCGSIVLAAVLLKMGGYGILCLLSSGLMFVGVVLFLSLLGGVWMAGVCFFQSDAKSLIAYSSVAHMNFMLGGLFSFFTKTKTFSVLVMVTHGYVSASLFYFIGGFFYHTLSRMIYFSSLSLKLVSAPLFLFFLSLCANFGVPPFLSSMAEFFFFSFFYLLFFVFSSALFFYGLMVCYFCIYLILILLHGKKAWSFSSIVMLSDSLGGALMMFFSANFFFLVFLS